MRLIRRQFLFSLSSFLFCAGKGVVSDRSGPILSLDHRTFITRQVLGFHDVPSTSNLTAYYDIIKYSGLRGSARAWNTRSNDPMDVTIYLTCGRARGPATLFQPDQFPNGCNSSHIRSVIQIVWLSIFVHLSRRLFSFFPSSSISSISFLFLFHFIYLFISLSLEIYVYKFNRPFSCFC